MKKGRPNSTTKGLRKDEVVKEISESTELKPAVVRSVLDCFTDIFIREVILHGVFHWNNCLDVSSKKRKSRRGYNVYTNEYKDYPETQYLSVKLSKKINNMFQWKQRNARNESNGVTKDNWDKHNND